MIKNHIAAENARLQKVLAERNRKIRQLEEQVSLLQTQLSDAEKLIASLQATSLGVLEDSLLDDLHDLDSIT
jgi:predicted  nucleic acid-binding Zn-ribbon protein